MKFTKMHGTGNDYIYIDARDLSKDWPSLARQMSDRHFGVGADGIILVLESDVADLKMRMFNADGSEGEMCGNGIRCFAKYAIEGGIVSSSRRSLEVETWLVCARWYRPSMVIRFSGARVSMGPPGLNPQDLPVSLEPESGGLRGPVVNYPCRVDGLDLPLTFVSMGIPRSYFP